MTTAEGAVHTRRKLLKYSAVEIAWLSRNRERPRRELHSLFVRKFSRDDVGYENIKWLCRTRGWTVPRPDPKPYRRLDKNGYWMINVWDKSRGTMHQLSLHRVEWEKVNGPVPEGMVLKCLGQKGDVRPENWVLIPRGAVNRLRSRGRDFANTPTELKALLLNVVTLEDHISQRTVGIRASLRARLK